MTTSCKERRKKMVSIKKTGFKTTTATMLKSLSLSNQICSSSESAAAAAAAATTTTTTSATNSRESRRTNDCKRISIRRQQQQQNRTRTVLAIIASLTIINQLTSNEGSQKLVEASNSTAVKSILLDTTEQRSLGWTKYPDGVPQTRTPGWVEESFTNFESGINWRTFVVCDVNFNSVNNWLWTPFIERNEANRLYIEIKFTIRDCNLFPEMVLSCKETFALLYKEMDSPIETTASTSSLSSSHQQQLLGAASNASFAHSDSYSLIDTIAADGGRFTSKDTNVLMNTEIRSIPVSKRGVYFAFRDQGACISLLSIKVYHLYCAKLHTNFAYFNSTPTGSGESSLVAVEGSCVPNSIQIEQPKMFCTADGTWNTMSSGQCKCLAGFEPASNQTKCQACPPGKFKSTLGDLSCQICPERSSAPFAGATECKCHDGYFRSSKDSRSMPCTQPPSAPWNLSATYVDSTSVILQWQQPRSTGNRDDLTYKLICDSCDQTMVSSPLFYSNFSETKCVLSGLSPSTTYRFVLFSMNGVSHSASATLQFQPQFSEITIQTLKQVQQTTQNTLSAQGGFQMTPIYNLRALPGARGSDMVLAWDVQPYQSSESAGGGLESIVSIQQQSSVMSTSDLQQYPSLYEVKYQPRHLTTSTLDSISRRSSPYPNSLIGMLSTTSSSQQQPILSTQQLSPSSVTTTNKAVAITTLQPNTEYAFQIRTKWSNTNQWTEFSAPIYMSTTNQMPSSLTSQIGNGFGQPDNAFGINYDSTDKFSFMLQTQSQAPTPSTNSSGSGWLGTFLLVSMCILISLAFLSITFIHYRKTNCMQSFAGGFGSFGGGGGGSGSTYGGVYGTNVASGLMSGPIGFGGPLGHAHHHATLSASSGGGLITGSNGTSRSSSGGRGGSVVQNFIAATLGQISGVGHSNNSRTSKASAFASPLSHHHNTSSQTMGGDGKLFASPASQHQPRNHYHQTLSGMNHTMLLNGGHGHFEQITGAANVNVAQLNGVAGGNNQFSADNNQPLVDPFKYRTLGQQGAHFVQQDPQMHIYDDLDNTCSLLPRQSNEIDPQRVSIESVIRRGEFGDVCLASLKSNLSGVESQVAVKTLKAQANDKAKLDFLVEASIMSQFEHPNIIRLEGVVTKSEPPMIICEFMENGSLDTYLRDNKNRFTCLQLISMLRGIANGMQYLAKLNYVHKDLAARNILVNGQNVCKIADFGLSVHQSLPGSGGYDNNNATDYTNDSSSTNSSNTLSSQATGSTPNTASTVAGSNNLNQLQSVAEQIAQQRFCLQQQHQQQHLINNQAPLIHHHSVQNPKIPVRWTALEAIAFRRFSSASDVWSYGIVCWEVMTQGERPYFNWSNQDVIKAVEQGYRLPQPDGCPEQLYKTMLDCWLKDRAARPTFSQILKTLDRLLSPYDDPLCQLPMHTNLQQQQSHITSCPPSQQPQLVPMHTRISSQEPAYYDTYNPISQLINNKSINQNLDQKQHQQSVDEWLNSIKMSRYRENFQRHQINSLQYVARLNQADLNLIGIQNNQHLKKITNAIASLRTTSSIGASGEGYLV